MGKLTGRERERRELYVRTRENVQVVISIMYTVIKVCIVIVAVEIIRERERGEFCGDLIIRMISMIISYGE